MKEIGVLINALEKDTNYTPIKTHTSETTLTASHMERESIPGQTEKYMMENGKLGISMVMESGKVNCLPGIHGDSYIGEWKLSKADGYGVHI